MSRNSEKAQSVLHRYQQQKNAENGVLESNPNYRPKFVQSVTSLPQAEKWRQTIASEISLKITHIQDPNINEYQIRDLNDEINKSINEKRAWEYHIRDLGGADYISFRKNYGGGGNLEDAGTNVRGYRYFGRAKQLPGVKEIIELQLDSRKKGTKEKKSDETEIYRERQQHLDPFYYGFYDEKADNSHMEDDIINEVNEIVGNGEEIIEVPHIENDNYHRDEEADEDLMVFEKRKSRRLLRQIREKAREDSSESFVPLDDFQAPSISEIESWLVEKRKRELIEKLGV